MRPARGFGNAVAAIAAIGYLGLDILGGSGGGEVLPDLPEPAEPVATRADAPAPVPPSDEIATAPTPAPPPVSDDPDRPLRGWELNTPDPPAGYIAIEPVDQGDPPAFWVKTHEVTNAEFRRFTADTFRTGAVEGPDDLPVTSVTIEDAKAYCEWVPKVLNLAPGQRIDLPTVAQFRRLMRAPVSHDRTAEPFDWPFYWRNAARRSRLEPPQQSPNDTLHFTTGRVYDLVGNVAEWGVDDTDGRGVVLGGDYTQTAWDFDPLEPRDPGPSAPPSVVGFRYVILGPAGR